MDKFLLESFLKAPIMESAFPIAFLANKSASYSCFRDKRLKSGEIQKVTRLPTRPSNKKVGASTPALKPNAGLNQGVVASQAMTPKLSAVPRNDKTSDLGICPRR